jgi:hypothetical protein
VAPVVADAASYDAGDSAAARSTRGAPACASIDAPGGATDRSTSRIPLVRDRPPPPSIPMTAASARAGAIGAR